MYKLFYTKQSLKDKKKLEKVSNLYDKAKKLIEIIKNNPYQNPPPYEKLVGDLSGAYSRRINIHNRIVYSVDEKEKTIRILRLWTHYE